MPRAKTAHRLATLPLLLLAFIAVGWSMAARHQAGIASTPERLHVEFPAAPDHREEVHVVYGHHSEALRPAEQPAPAASKTAGNNNEHHGGARIDAALLPADFLPASHHSQSALKQRLCALLTRAELSQRLALYPKHGFW